MTDCTHVQARLAEQGVEAAAREDIKRHLKDCADCTKVLGDLRRLESALDELPEHDATDALVAKTLEAVRRDGAEPKPWPWQRGLAAGIAASVVIAAGVGITMSVYQPSYKMALVDRDEVASTKNNENLGDKLALGPETEAEEAPSSSLRKSESQSRPAPAEDMSESFEMAQLAQKKVQEGYYRSELNEEISRELDVIAQLETRARQEHGAFEGAKAKADNRLDRGAEKEALASDERQVVVGGSLSSQTMELESLDSEVLELEDSFADDKSLHAQLRDEGRVAGQAGADPAVVGESSTVGSGQSLAENKRRNIAPSLAAGFLFNYQDLDNLSFQEPTGYWANSYIPGDPAMRLLQARLAAWDRGALGQDLRLEQDIAPIAQPFDGPRDAAIALYLHSDAPAIDGPTRLRVQIGVKGAERQGGHRPAMNIGLVVDQRELLDLEAATRVRALIDALQRAHQPGDRFSLTVAGPDGGLLVPAEDFRHGPLSVALDRMLTASSGAPLDLPAAMELAAESVLAGDDPNGVLGSSLVLLVTGGSLAGDIAALEGMAHRNAVGGVSTSVVSLAARDDLSHIDRLVAAGQGHRRVLDSAQAAEGVVDRELHAASRAVARALRLRIRLAPGVKLIDVLGSERLGAPQAERVREAEQAIDKRLARTLGIDADRGEDEDGIQIVIPNFYAGDSHVILLDLVAEAPGPIADVTLRYKDVVTLGNGVAQASLTLGDEARAAGPLELNVRKNLAALEFARQARVAGRALTVGDVHQATGILTSLRDLLHGLREEVPAWQSDPDLAADEALLSDYLVLLASPLVGDAVQRRNLADSLQVAAFRKVQPAAP